MLPPVYDQSDHLSTSVNAPWTGPTTTLSIVVDSPPVTDKLTRRKLDALSRARHAPLPFCNRNRQIVGWTCVATDNDNDASPTMVAENDRPQVFTYSLFFFPFRLFKFFSFFSNLRIVTYVRLKILHRALVFFKRLGYVTSDYGFQERSSLNLVILFIFLS